MLPERISMLILKIRLKNYIKNILVKDSHSLGWWKLLPFHNDQRYSFFLNFFHMYLKDRTHIFQPNLHIFKKWHKQAKKTQSQTAEKAPWRHKTDTCFSTNNEDKRLKSEFMICEDNAEEVYTFSWWNHFLFRNSR